jgi:DNA replication protein DnaC
MDKGEFVLAITWPSYVRKIKDKWEERQKRINFVIDRPILLIDDLFQKGTTPTEADIDIAWEIMEARNTYGRPTIITSERYLNEIFDLRESLHGRIKAHVGRNVIEIKRGIDRNNRLEE